MSSSKINPKDSPVKRKSNPVSTYLKMSSYSRSRSAQSAGGAQPKSMTRPKVWSEEVEEAYRFQVAGYRDEIDYKSVFQGQDIDRWPCSGFVKKLQRKDGCFYYYNKARECPEKEVHKTKLYSY